VSALEFVIILYLINPIWYVVLVSQSNWLCRQSSASTPARARWVRSRRRRRRQRQRPAEVLPTLQFSPCSTCTANGQRSRARPADVVVLTWHGVRGAVRSAPGRRMFPRCVGIAAGGRWSRPASPLLLHRCWYHNLAAAATRMFWCCWVAERGWREGGVWPVLTLSPSRGASDVPGKDRLNT